MPYFRKVVGERCYLSPIDPADAPAFTAWLNDAEVAAGVTFTRRVVNVEQERDGLVRLAAEPYNFAIVALDGDELLGSCGIVFPASQRCQTAPSSVARTRLVRMTG